MGAYGSPQLGMYSNNQGNGQNDKYMIYCQKCGFLYNKRIKKCPQCGAKHAQPFYHKWWFWVLVVFVILGVYPQSQTNKVSQSVPLESAESAISEEEYKQQCKTIPYEEIARNPNFYNGQPVRYTGNVVQVQESGNFVMLRVNVTKGEYGIWNDTIYVEYKHKLENEPRILENDIVTVYGNMNGIKTYTAVFGNQISVPYLIAEYITIN